MFDVRLQFGIRPEWETISVLLQTPSDGSGPFFFFIFHCALWEASPSHPLLKILLAAWVGLCTLAHPSGTHGCAPEAGDLAPRGVVTNSYSKGGQHVPLLNIPTNFEAHWDTQKMPVL